MLKRSIAVISILSALVLAQAAAAITPTETYQAALGQVNAGKVTEAVINKETHDAKLTLSDGTMQLVVYPPADERTFSRTLRSHGALVKFPRKAKKAATAHHHIRYIAGGVLVALIVIGGGLYVITRRQSEVGGEPATAAAASAAPPEPPAQDDAEQPPTS